jgi:hypothetical protein
VTPKAAVKSPSSEYERLEEVARPKPVRDLSQAWDERYRPLGEANEVVLSRIRHFCDEKPITLTALECMGTRFAVRNGGAVWLAWAASVQLNGSRIVTAVKSRELGSGQRTAEPGSTFVEPAVFGNLLAPDWYLFEGESDAARGLELVTGKAAVMVLPAGALTFRPEWASVIPRGATVFLCHDADEAGDKGAAKVARIIGSNAVRLRPPVEGGDWCNWAGEREQFAELVATAGRVEAVLEIRSARELCALPDPPEEEQLLGPLLLRGQRLVLGAHTGEGKTSMALQIVRALTTGGDFLDWQGSGGRVIVLDAEQGLRTVKRRLRRDPSDGVVRDLREELLDVLGDGEWRTQNELRKPKDEGGIGADRDKVKAELELMTDDGLLEFTVGPEGRRKDSKCWRMKWREPADATYGTSPEPDSQGEAEKKSGVVASP